MKSVCYLVFFSILFTGCQLFGSKDSDTFTIAPNEVSIANKQFDSVTFTVVNTCASGCWINIEDLVQNDGYEIEIRIVAEESGQPCPTVCLELRQDVIIEIPAPGVYSFQFIHRDSVHHELELSFP